ncbi:MAG: glycosyltransferase family 39 protein [Deltaproteobacteria bacterium]|nr:MAG: glycosyltransferase family 39 protein [Deltaproteobacteria bacterium]
MTAAVAEPRDVAWADSPRPTRLLDARDVGLMLALMALALGLRLAYFSGFGLGDDVIYRHFINNILVNHYVLPDNTAYRVAWWLPTAFACRILGLSEAGMIAPVTIVATLGIGLLYAFGKALWGRPGGLIAALLLLVHPLDFAWSTMLASDIFASFFSALTILCLLRALGHDDVVGKRRCWMGAAASLWLTYHAKVSAVLLVPPVLLICWRRRHRIDRRVAAFPATAGLLFGASALVSYVFTGDPIAPYHAEISYQGLTGETAINFHRLTAYVFWAFPRAVLLRDQWGDLLFSVYPHLLLALFLVSPLLGIRTSLDVFLWLLFVAVGMQLNIQRVHGVWVAGFRNVRHIHVLVYPVVLLLAGYLTGLRARFPRVSAATIAVLLGVSAWQSVSTATKTHVAFADCRNACRFLDALPPKTVYADFQINTWASIVPGWKQGFHELERFDRAKRRAQIAAIQSGYLVTGGAREPYYGCIDCIPRAEEVSGTQWRLLKEFPSSTAPTGWRPEPLRVWEAVEPGADAPETPEHTPQQSVDAARP